MLRATCVRLAWGYYFPFVLAFFGVNGFGGVLNAFPIPRMKRSSAPGSSSIIFLGFLLMSKHPDPLDEIAPLIGHVNLAWNNLQFWVFCVFWKLLDVGAMKADSIFFALRTDRAQRDITLQLIKATMFNFEELRHRLEDLIERANKLAGRRNDVIHAMIFVDHPATAAQVFASSSPRLSKKDLTTELKDLVLTIKALNSEFATSAGQLDARAEREKNSAQGLNTLGLLAPLLEHGEPPGEPTPMTEEHSRKDEP